MKKCSSLIDLSYGNFQKINYGRLCIFQNYALRAKLCNFASTHNFKALLVAEKQLNEIVSKYGIEKLSVPDDRDCWFTSISFLLEKVLNGNNNAVLQQSLIILRNQDISNRNILLR